MELTDKVIVVTGAARGIGRALARRFVVDHPKAVVVADLDGDGAQTVGQEIGGKSVQCDVSRETDIVRLVQEVEDIHGRIDIFCSNAGIGVGGGPEAVDDYWQRIWQVNVMAHVYVARHVLPGMLARKEGYLVGTVSAAGLLNHMFAAPYGVTKAAALSFFEWLAIAHGDSGIRVRVMPGARMLKIVVMKLIAPSIEDAPATCIDRITKSTAGPGWPEVESGA